MQIYLIKSGESVNGDQFSHDDHGEFFLNQTEAENRVKELSGMLPHLTDFHVVKAELIETTDRDDNTIAISDTWEIGDIYEKAEEMGIAITNIQAGEILDYVYHHIDNEYGISWDTVENAIKEIVKN